MIQKQPPEVFHKKDVLENFVKLMGKHLCRSRFFNKITGQKRGSYTTVFQWILRNFHECVFYRTPLDDSRIRKIFQNLVHIFLGNKLKKGVPSGVLFIFHDFIYNFFRIKGNIRRYLNFWIINYLLFSWIIFAKSQSSLYGAPLTLSWRMPLSYRNQLSFIVS